MFEKVLKLRELQLYKWNYNNVENLGWICKENYEEVCK